MIQSYRDKRTAAFAKGDFVREFQGFAEQAYKRLEILDAAELARQIAVPANRISQIINGKRAITGDTALRLGHWFGTSAQSWLNLQTSHELILAQQQAGDTIAKLPKRVA